MNVFNGTDNKLYRNHNVLVEGNPLEDITAIGGHHQWLDAPPRGPEVEPIRLIMKDGTVYKNTLWPIEIPE